MDSDLIELAAAHGVATSYRDGERKVVEVDEDVVVRILGLLDVDAAEPEARTAALARAREKAALGALPGTIAHRVGAVRPLPGPGVLINAEGTRIDVTELPDDLEPGLLPPGAGRRAARPRGHRGRGTGRAAGDAAVVGLDAAALRAALAVARGASATSATCASSSSWTGREHGAEAVLLNPLHAITPVPPVQASPYTPSSRRFATPLALRVTDLDAYRTADDDTRAQVDALRPDTAGDRIEHDRVWAAKRSACELLWHSAGRPEPIGAPDDLWQFAIFCALAERYGSRWSRWPEGLRHPAAPDVDRARVELAPRVAFHAWLQDQVQRQLSDVRGVAQEVGVRVVHDLAVGCDPEGADGWALQDVLAMGVHAGAPPDAFSQQGQDWGLPPWRPDRLDATGYAAYRDLLRATLRAADGLRIDHVAGLWRLWWVPPGESPDRRHLRALRLRRHARRADAGGVAGRGDGDRRGPRDGGAGGDRGAGASATSSARPCCGSPATSTRPATRCCRRTGGTRSRSRRSRPTTCRRRRASCAASTCASGPSSACSTTRPRSEARAELDRLELVELLREEGLVSGDDPGEDQLVVAMHALLARSRSRLVLISPYDVIGEVRQPNLPGTVDQYPNWRLPAAGEPGGAARRPAGAGGGRRAAPGPAEEQRLTCRSRW